MREYGAWRKALPVSAMKAYRGSRGKTPLILTSTPVGYWSPSLSDRFTQGQKPRYPLNRRLGVPQSRSGSSEKKNLLPLSGFEPEMSLHDVKIGVWYAMGAARVITSILAEATNSHPCITHTRAQLLEHLTEYDRTYSFFWKSVSSSHHKELNALPGEWLSHRIIIRCLWPPHPPDLMSCDFYLKGTLNDEVYWNNPRSETTCKKTFKKQCLEYHQQNSDVHQATYLLNVTSVG